MRSSGCPVSLQPAVMRSIRSARAFIASSVVSYDIVFDGKAHMLPSVIDPKPHALFPARVVHAAVDVQQRDAVHTRPPNLYGAR